MSAMSPTPIGVSRKADYDTTSQSASPYQFLRSLVLSLLISAGAYGAFVAQCLAYILYFRGKDRTLFRILVPLLVLLNTLYLTLYVAYFLQVIQKLLSLPPFFESSNAEYWLMIVLRRSVPIIIITAAFFLLQVHSLYPHWIITTVGVLLLTLVQICFALSIVYQLQSTAKPYLASKVQIWQGIGLWGGIVLEVYVAAILLLRRHKTKEIKGRPMIRWQRPWISLFVPMPSSSHLQSYPLFYPHCETIPDCPLME